MKKTPPNVIINSIRRSIFMKDFITLIKRISAEWIIYNFSELSIEMFKKQEYWRDIEVPVKVNGRARTLIVKLSAWDIQNIEYLSICNSNDYRQSDRPFSIGELVDLYRDYENEHSVSEAIKNATGDDVFRLLMGMTAEQFQYQDCSWIYDTFNRNYHILLAAQNFEHRVELNIDDIVQEVFGLSANNYMSVLLIVFWLCMKHPDPLTAPEELYRKKEETVLTKENISKLVEYYSCTYEDLRTSLQGKQLLYSKPFIKTDRQRAYLSSNLYLVAMLIANGLYWVARDFYRLQDSQKFTNAFGHLYEDYIKELADTYCEPEQWHIISQGKEKGADFFFAFESASMIVETKTTLIGLNAKQQVPNLQDIDKFMSNTIERAYSQLQSTYNQIVTEQEKRKPIIKVILLYDDFSNTALLQQSMTQIFDNDALCFIMTIREFEILLNLHHNDYSKCQKVLKRIIEQENLLPIKRKSISTIYDEFVVWKISHFSGELGYFSQGMTRLEKEIEKNHN